MTGTALRTSWSGRERARRGRSAYAEVDRSPPASPRMSRDPAAVPSTAPLSSPCRYPRFCERDSAAQGRAGRGEVTTMPDPAKEVGRRCRRGRSWSSAWPARAGRGAASGGARRDVRAVDSGHPDGAAGLAGSASKLSWIRMDWRSSRARDTVVKSPGVPREAPVIAAALERGIEVIGELELAWRAIPNRFLAVTGTNGKTTTVELLGHIYRSAGEPVAVAGNVGIPLSGLVGEIDPDGDRGLRGLQLPARGQPRLRPGGRRLPQPRPRPPRPPRRPALPTATAKLRIFANQGNDDVAVWNGDDPALAGVDLGGCARRIAFCRGAGARLRGRGWPRGRSSDDGEPLIGVEELGMLGEHNVENAMAAAAAALSMGIDRDAVRDGPAQLRRRAAPARAGRRDRRRPLRQRLQGDQRRLRRGRDRRLRRRRPRDPRRQRQGRALRAAGRAAARARRRRLPARRHRRTGWQAELAPARRGRRAAAPRRRPRGRGPHAPPPRRVPARSSCSRPPAPASTPSANFEARGERFRQIVAGLAVSALALALGRARPRKAKKKRKRRRARAARLDRVQPAADRDALPARLRRGDGLLRLLDHPGPAERRPRRLAPTTCSAR